ncbi:putative low-complexity protein [Actibacterium atlanticum]|uniref:Putative low-complexity protein n=1 Tax=Actibacterium atlanticum TaxID=1461693 RepID=A0A058ZPW4_9RHOB|nr:pentapeptide repeat-containing protein [Actibacterium atlanticum]KCV83192.1 putative low-complexity protein [Actibacterium atlanticum]
MGNPQHLEWLLEGVEAWNARRESDDFVPDLSGFDIRRAYKKTRPLLGTSSIDLRRTNLRAAILSDTNLVAADLRGANLQSSNMRRANLRRSQLASAELNHADLRGADLWNADFGREYDQKASVKNVNVRTIISAGQYLNTKLLELPSLTQTQVDAMNGDTGTILRFGLTHPPHWPDPEGIEPAPQLPDPLEPMPDPATNPSARQLAALKTQVQVILAAPAQNANTAETFAAQLDYATQTFRQANNCNDLPDDLLLVEQVSDTFKQLAKAIPSADEDSLAKELTDALAKIEKLRATIEKQTAEIEELKKKGADSSVWRKGTSAFAISFGTTLGAGTAAAILSGGEIMLGEYGASALNGLRNAFDGLFQAPPPPPPPTLPPSIGT